MLSGEHDFLSFSTAPYDYNETMVELTFQPSDAVQAFTIPVLNDNVLEVEETFTGRLILVGDQRGVSLGRDLADFIINDDDCKFIVNMMIVSCVEMI